MLGARFVALTSVLCLCTWPALAVDWGLSGTASQRFSANFNPRLETDGEGGAYGSSTVVRALLSADTKRARWRLRSEARLSVFGGPANDDDLDRPSPRLDGEVRLVGKRSVLGARFGFRRTSTSFLNLNPGIFDPLFDDDVDEIVIDPDDLFVEEDATETRLNLGGNYSFQVTKLDRLSLAVSGGIRRFSNDNDSLTDTSRFSGSAVWQRQLNASSFALLNFGAGRFLSDNDRETETTSYNTGVGYGFSLSKSFSAQVDLGVSYSTTREQELQADGSRVPRNDVNVAFAGGASATYRRDEDTRFSIFARQEVRPDTTTGGARNVFSLGGAVDQRLTEATRFNLRARHAVRDGDDGDLEQSFSLSPQLRYNFAPDWSASLGYTLRLNSDEDGLGIGNRVFVGVSRNLQFLD
ncbi:MAG: hypothetical protein ACFBRM_03700 [Pikeienuella sp.]